MYRTLTVSSCMCVEPPSGAVQHGQQEADAVLDVGCDAFERRVGRVVAVAFEAGVGDAPVDGLGRPGELGADLPDAVAEGDDEVEPSPGELPEVLGRSLGRCRCRGSRRTRTAFGCTGLGWLPALTASTCPSESTSRRASAICERVPLPVQRNSTCGRRRVARRCSSAVVGSNPSPGCSDTPDAWSSSRHRGRSIV